MRLSIYLVVLGFFPLIPNTVQGQLAAPERDTVLLTQYSNTTEQDSIFVFYGDFGTLRASHSTGNGATFKWYRYNSLISNPAQRFELIYEEAGVTASQLNNLAEGGYRVMVTDITDSTEVFTCWLFTDNVVLSRIDTDNQCQFLELTAATAPPSYDIIYDRFVYHDLSRSTQPERNTWGQAYFSNTSWQASDSRIELPETNQLRLAIENPAPLYKSTYTITIVNPFGRMLTLTTPEIDAIATKAVNLIQVDDKGTWKDWDSNSRYEALLGLRLESKSLNSDSIYWRVLTTTITPNEIYDRIIWSDSTLLSVRNEAFPDKKLMVPGYYKVKHYSVNSLSGCIDSVITSIQVDSSRINPDVIPNVFSPNGDSKNDYFKFNSTDESIRSIRSFSVNIYSRSGKLIYTYNGNPIDWEGWDGKTNHGTDAAEGVYFFIIEAKGWDERTFARGPYKGFLYLYRGK